MRSSHLLDRARTALVVIDVQERYRTRAPRLGSRDDRVRSAAAGRPASRHTRDGDRAISPGLGHTAEELARHFGARHGCREAKPQLLRRPGRSPTRSQRWHAAGARAGIETHACVNQTVHDLVAAGYQVHVAEDATSSRWRAMSLPHGRRCSPPGCCPRRANKRCSSSSQRQTIRSSGIFSRCSRTPGDWQ